MRASRVLRAALAYFGLVFAAAFLLGVVRVLWIVPRLGTRAAELLEMPVVLAVAFVAARGVLGRRDPPPGPAERAAVGTLALGLLVAAELALALGLRGLSPAQLLAERDPVSGIAYLLALLLFAAMPVIAGVPAGGTKGVAAGAGGSGEQDAVAIRSLAPDDHGACRALWAALTAHHRRLYDDPTIGGDDPGAGFEAWQRRPDRVAAWVAEREGEVVGMAGLLVPQGGDEGEVEPVVVRPDRRGEGVGAALVAQAVDEARRRGLRFANVRPVGRNRRAIRFFAGCGFDLLGRVELSMALDEELEAGFGNADVVELDGRRLRR